MRLGERISQYRRSLGISQEELGARLGVSRQAVSKWETGAATPDMANLMALAREFGVSVAELTETPEEPQSVAELTEPPEPPQAEKKSRENLRLFLFPILIVLLTLALFVAGGVLWTNFGPGTPPPAAPPPEASLPETEFRLPEREFRLPEREFRLQWHIYEDGFHPREFLALGPQETVFPFGTTSLELSAPEEIYDSDFSCMTHHVAPCGSVTIEYNRIIEEGRTRDVITSLSTLQSIYATPRGIFPGETEDDLLQTYDGLVYCLKEEGGYTLVPHDYYYAKSAFEEDLGWAVILFYIRDGQVAGIRMETLGELGDFYTPDNISRFPMKNGEPDFSLREEPEQEPLSDTRRVYIAFNRLVSSSNLTAEEQYACRRDIFTLLPDMDWSELGQMGMAEYPSDTIFALMEWLIRQDAYTESEIFRIQTGSVAKGIDGAYAESYGGLLSRVFFYDPAAFIRNLTRDWDSEEDWRFHSVLGAAFDGVWYPQELAAARDTLNAALSGSMFTAEESGWCRLMLRYLEAAERDDFEGLPRSPSELS